MTILWEKMKKGRVYKAVTKPSCNNLFRVRFEKEWGKRLVSQCRVTGKWSWVLSGYYLSDSFRYVEVNKNG